jgi:predicted nucleotidyltransferase
VYNSDELIAVCSMVTMKEIRSVSRQIAREFRPRRVILFGSYARGTATENSDVDLLVIADSSQPRSRRSARIAHSARALYTFSEDWDVGA